MGHFANYVVIEHGKPDIYFSRWGGLGISQEIMAGPDSTITGIRRRQPVETLQWDAEMEGGVVIDIDQKRLRFFDGDLLMAQPHIMRLLLPLVRQQWVGWDADWALYGAVDLARALGWPDSAIQFIADSDRQLLETTAPILATDEMMATDDLKRANAVLMVRWEDGNVGDYLLTTARESPARWSLCEDALTLGPDLLRLVRDAVPGALPREDNPPGLTAFADVANRSLWVGDFQRLRPHRLAAVARRWPGWNVRGHIDGLARQVALSGRDPAPILVPREEAVTELITNLHPDDPERLRMRLAEIAPYHLAWADEHAEAESGS